MNWYDRLLVYMMNEFMLWHQDDSVEDGSMYACMDGRMDLRVVHLISPIYTIQKNTSHGADHTATDSLRIYAERLCL